MSNPKPYVDTYELNKDQAKKEAAAEVMRTRCNICFKETFPQRLCGGHKGKNGSSGGGENFSEKTYKSKDQSPLDSSTKISDIQKQPIDLVLHPIDYQAFDINGQVLGQELTLDTQAFDPEVILELLLKKLLLIENDSKVGALTIKLQCSPNSLTQKQKIEITRFIASILKEFTAFKKEYNIAENCEIINKDMTGNILSLRIMLATSKLYTAFVEQLANNLLPTQADIKPVKATYQLYGIFFKPALISKEISIINEAKSMEDVESDKAEQQRSHEKEKTLRFHSS